MPDDKTQPAKPVAQQTATRDRSPIYAVDGLARELRQSEIICDLTQYIRDPEVAGEVPDQFPISAVRHPYAIILSQDCDLLWDFDARENHEVSELNGVLLYEAEPANEVRADRELRSDLWKPIRQNKSDRYHFLEAVPATLDLLSEGLPQLLIDFKRCFTLPPDEIYRQLNLRNNPARRRCRLEMPYREHLQSRAAFYLQRVMLPLDHRYLSPDEEVKILPKRAGG